MTTFIIIFILFVLYMIACCMDGPDLKPLWKRWLGIKLEGYANQLKPIHYCQGVCCGYYKLANETLPLYEKRYTQLIEEIAKMNALNSRPTLIMQKFEAMPIESCVMLTKGDIYEARMYQDMMRQHGIPDWQIPRHKSVSFMIEEAKEKCVRNLLNEAKQFASVNVDEESRWPGIIITAKMLVGKKNEYIDLEK